MTAIVHVFDGPGGTALVAGVLGALLYGAYRVFFAKPAPRTPGMWLAQRALALVLGVAILWPGLLALWRSTYQEEHVAAAAIPLILWWALNPGERNRWHPLTRSALGLFALYVALVAIVQLRRLMG